MASLATVLRDNKNLVLTENNRIKCSYSGHEMPAKVGAVLQYLNSKNFVKTKEWYSYDYSEFAPHIVESKEDPKKLFCKLTKQPLNKMPDEVRKHVNGKRFRRLKLEHEEMLKQKAQAKEDEELDIWVPIEEVDNESLGSNNSEDEEADEDSQSEHEELIVKSKVSKQGQLKHKKGNAQRKTVEPDVELGSKGSKRKAKSEVKLKPSKKSKK